MARHRISPRQHHRIFSCTSKFEKCILPVLIHRAITCDSFKVLPKKKPKRCWVTIKKKKKKKKKKDPKSYFLTSNDPRHAPKSYYLTSSDPRHAPRGKILASLYSTLHNLRLDIQHGYVCIKWILDPSGPYPLALPPRTRSKFRMSSSSPHQYGYPLWQFRESSLNGLGTIGDITDGLTGGLAARRTDGRGGITLSPFFLRKARG